MTPTFKTIVVPTDFSVDAGRALRYAEQLAAEPGATLHVVHAVDMPIVPALWSAELYVPDMTTAERRAVADAEHRLGALSAELTNRGLRVKSAVVLGDAARAVTHYASEAHADLVVVGTRTRAGLTYPSMGRVAEQIVRHAQCPVLTVGADASAPHAGAMHGETAAA